jgi:hypothetical protein
MKSYTYVINEAGAAPDDARLYILRLELILRIKTDSYLV